MNWWTFVYEMEDVLGVKKNYNAPIKVGLRMKNFASLEGRF